MLLEQGRTTVSVPDHNYDYSEKAQSLKMGGTKRVKEESGICRESSRRANLPVTQQKGTQKGEPEIDAIQSYSDGD